MLAMDVVLVVGYGEAVTSDTLRNRLLMSVGRKCITYQNYVNNTHRQPTIKKAFMLKCCLHRGH